MSISSETILCFRVLNSGLSTCLDEILFRLRDGSSPFYLVCANPHTLEVAKKDSLFCKAIENADLVVPDGIGIVFASHVLGGKIRQRITGSDIFWEVNKLLNNEHTYSCFFLGATENTLHRIRERMSIDFPNVRVVGTFSPPFKEEFAEDENDVMVEAVNRANPDILWVGMTAPKQEKWIYENRERLQAKFVGAIGAVFDFFAGTKKRSNSWFQDCGLEWLPRLVREPRRLWRRNLVSSPMFFARVISHRMKYVGNRSGRQNPY